MKYRILQYWSTDGFTLIDEEYETVNDAVVSALEKNYGSRFLIIQVIDWEAKEKTV